MSFNHSVVPSWSLPGQAEILPIGMAAVLIEQWRAGVPKPVISLTSGGFDPIHPGHISCIQESKEKVEQFRSMDSPHLFQETFLVVVVNDASFLKRKKGVEFMPLKARCQVISALRGVDIVVPFASVINPTDMSVNEALDILRPDYFTKGGDRGKGNVPEEGMCKKHDIEIIYGCGDNKYWSSSNLLEDYKQYVYGLNNG